MQGRGYNTETPARLWEGGVPDFIKSASSKDMFEHEGRSWLNTMCLYNPDPIKSYVLFLFTVPHVSCVLIEIGYIILLKPCSDMKYRNDRPEGVWRGPWKNSFGFPSKVELYYFEYARPSFIPVKRYLLVGRSVDSLEHSVQHCKRRQKNGLFSQTPPVRGIGAPY